MGDWNWEGRGREKRAIEEGKRGETCLVVGQGV
jgi:hypothetical protein